MLTRTHATTSLVDTDEAHVAISLILDISLVADI